MNSLGLYVDVIVNEAEGIVVTDGEIVLGLAQAVIEANKITTNLFNIA
jgi:hypothetical protein